MRIIRWLIYTVIVGALPILVRLLVYLISNHIPNALCFSPIDIVFFGLTLNISNINEVNGLKPKRTKKVEVDVISNYKDAFSALSTLLIIFLAIPLGALYMGELTDQTIINQTTAFIGAIVLSVLSLVFSSIVMYNVLKLQKHGNN